jgi:putative restriction endonuclease
LRAFIAITDWDWFSYLSRGDPLDEVNFWQPGGNLQFRALLPGEPFLFKLHSPRNFIVGGGFFSHSTLLPVSYAWKAFGSKNGALTEEEMRSRVEHYRSEKPKPAEDYQIGCILLEGPFFFKEQDWIPVPDWHSNIVVGKRYETNIEPGRSIWERIEAILKEKQMSVVGEVAIGANDSRFGSPQITMPRLGQGSFRVIVADAYKRRCAFTGSPILHVLDAAHIKPYSKGGTHSPGNGILLRQDFHTLFDQGYITVTTGYKIEVSKRLKEEFDNGREYYLLHGQAVTIPTAEQLRPATDLLSWHNEHVFHT